MKAELANHCLSVLLSHISESVWLQAWDNLSLRERSQGSNSDDSFDFSKVETQLKYNTTHLCDVLICNW